jgi:hypothetical protein
LRLQRNINRIIEGERNLFIEFVQEINDYLITPTPDFLEEYLEAFLLLAEISIPIPGPFNLDLDKD